MPAEVIGKNIGAGRFNRWLLKIIGPASVGGGPRQPQSDADSLLDANGTEAVGRVPDGR